MIDFLKYIAAGMCCFEKSLGCLSGGDAEELAKNLVRTNVEIFQVCGTGVMIFLSEYLILCIWL